MKAYTDIPQSKKLAEFLPIESADGTWKRIVIAGCNLGVPEEQQYFHDGDTAFVFYSGIGIPSWSLAALLAIIPYPTLGKHADETWSCASWVEKVNPYFVEGCDTPIDACVAMIEKLHEQKLL